MNEELKDRYYDYIVDKRKSTGKTRSTLFQSKWRGETISTGFNDMRRIMMFEEGESSMNSGRLLDKP